MEQKVQLSMHPTCEEIHRVPRPGSGMKTVSTALPPDSDSKSHFTVPSTLDLLANDPRGGRTSASWLKVLRRLRERSVICAKVSDPALVNPLQNLPGTERLLAEFGKKCGESFPVKTQKIYFFFLQQRQTFTELL